MLECKPSLTLNPVLRSSFHLCQRVRSEAPGKVVLHNV